MADATIQNPYDQGVKYIPIYNHRGKDPGHWSGAFFKANDGDTIQATQLGLKTIHHCFSVNSQNPLFRMSGSVVQRGSKANQVELEIGSVGTTYNAGSTQYGFILVQGEGH